MWHVLVFISVFVVVVAIFVGFLVVARFVRTVGLLLAALAVLRLFTS